MQLAATELEESSAAGHGHNGLQRQAMEDNGLQRQATKRSTASGMEDNGLQRYVRGEMRYQQKNGFSDLVVDPADNFSAD